MYVEKVENGFAYYSDSNYLGSEYSEGYFDTSTYMNYRNGKQVGYLGYYRKFIHLTSDNNELVIGFDRVLPDGDYIISSAANPFCFLDIDGAAVPASNHDNVQIYYRDNLDDIPEADIWTITYDSSDKFYTIKQKGTNMSLDADTQSQNIQVYTSSQNNKAQKWAISRDGRTGYRLKSARNGLSADVNTAVIESGQNVQQWTDIDYKAQSWIFIPYKPTQPIEEGRHVILFTSDSSYKLCVSGENGGDANNTTSQIWNDEVPSRYNSFDFIKLSNGYYKIQHASSGRCLDVTDFSSNYKTKVSVRDDNGSAAQQWTVMRNGEGWSLISRCNGYALDLPDGTLMNGMELQVYPSISNDHQRWTLVRAENTVSYRAPEADSGVPSEQIKFYGEPLTVSADIPARKGYAFLGWAINENATSPQYQPGDSYSENSDLTLYAIWFDLSSPDGMFPAELTTIEDEALARTQFRYLKFPDKLTTLGSRILDGCDRLIVVYIPPSITNIARDAFAGAPDALIILGEADSDIAGFASAYGIRFETVELP